MVEGNSSQSQTHMPVWIQLHEFLPHKKETKTQKRPTSKRKLHYLTKLTLLRISREQEIQMYLRIIIPFFPPQKWKFSSVLPWKYIYENWSWGRKKGGQ